MWVGTKGDFLVGIGARDGVSIAQIVQNDFPPFWKGGLGGINFAERSERDLMFLVGWAVKIPISRKFNLGGAQK